MAEAATYDGGMHRRIEAVAAVVSAIVVFAIAAYVIAHRDPVAQAGQTPGYTSPTHNPGGSGSASAPSTGGSRPVVAFLGDDYTAGTAASSTAKRFTTLVSTALGLTEKNFGRDGTGYAKVSRSGGGDYTTRGSAIVAARPDVVVVSGGRNDVIDFPATMAAHAEQLFADLHAKLPNAVLVAVAPFWGDSAPAAALKPVTDAVKKAVRAAGGTYLDLGDPLRGHPQFMADAADPNDHGYAAIATALEPRLAPLIPNATAIN